MSDLVLVRRLFASKPLQNLLAVLVMAASIAVAVSILLLSEGIYSGLVRAAQPFPLLAGAKGSPNQLVLNSVFLQDQPIGNFPYAEVEQLRQNKNTQLAVPIGLGDNFRGMRIVGSEQEIFQLSGIGQEGRPWLQIAEGRSFAGEYEAVLGAEAAARSGLKIGDTFQSVHGVVSGTGASHKEKFTVVGILQPVHGPYDSSILVDLASIWHMHGAHHAAAESEHGAEAHAKEVTAVIVRPQGYANALQLAAEYAKNKNVQLIFPSKTIIELFSVLGNLEKVLQIFSLAVIALALLIIACSLYWLIASSRREQGIMRALGASAEAVMRIYFKLGFAMTAGGTILGFALGHAIFAAFSIVLQSKTSLYLTAGLLPKEGLLLLLVLLCGALCSLAPVKLSAPENISEVF